MEQKEIQLKHLSSEERKEDAQKILRIFSDTCWTKRAPEKVCAHQDANKKVKNNNIGRKWQIIH